MKNVALILGLMIAASPAFASRARLEALGEGKNGSYYINDSRNIFLNPAQIVKHKKKLWLEFGTEPSGMDLATAPRGQGGFSNTFGDFTYGLYLNQTSERTLRTISALNAALGAGTFLQPDSTIEAFFAGEGGMNWGISVFYAGNSATSKSMSQLGTRLGIESGNLSVFTTVGIITKSTVNDFAAAGNTVEAKGKIGIDAGITYTMDNMTFFGKFLTVGTDLTVALAPTSNNELKSLAYGAGFGYTKEWSKTVTMFSRLEFDNEKTTASGASTTAWNVPVVLGAEAQALSWLALRGSIAQSLLGKAESSNLAGTTTVAAGLGATFGDVNIDGLLSMGNVVTTGVPGFGTGPNTTGTTGFGDNMLGRVAMTYNF